MYPYLLPEIFGYHVPLYDVLVFIGVFAMIIYLIYRFDKIDGFKKEETNILIIFIFISLFVGIGFTFLLDGIFHSIKAGEISFGSVSFLGSLIGGLAAFLLLIKFFYRGNKTYLKMINALITGVVLAHAIGRIGCFFAGCCYGVPTDSILGVVFPHGLAAEAYPNQALYPTQLLESLFLFILFICLNKVKPFKKRELQVYLISYGLFRFLIEFIRGDNRGEVFVLFKTKHGVFPSPAQLISFLMIIIGVVLIFIFERKGSRNDAEKL